MLFIGPWESLFFSKPLFPLSYTQGANHSFYIIRLCQVKKKTDLDKEKLYSKGLLQHENLQSQESAGISKTNRKGFSFPGWGKQSLAAMGSWASTWHARQGLTGNVSPCGQPIPQIS